MPEGPLITPTRFEDAIYKLSTKAPMAAALRSDEWQKVPVALRERAFFSATVESVQYLQAMRSFLDEFLINKREKLADGTEVLKSQGRAQFVADMQEKAAALGMPPLMPGKAGTIEDPAASGRLRLIFDTVTQQAYDYGYFKQGQDPAVLNAFPAQRFIREHSVSEPRDYHESNKGVVRRKDDKEFWLSMNRDFRVPWGPWGFNSGMGVEDVDREEAEALGLVSPTEQLQPNDADFNQELAASVSGLDTDMKELLKRAFGKQVEFSGDKVKWKGQQFAQPKAQRLRKSLQAPKAAPTPGEAIPNSPDAPLSLPNTAQEDGFPPLDRLVKDKGLGGSTGAELWRDPKTGARFVVKRGASAEHLRSEFAADEAYRALGVRVPAAKLLETPEGPVKLARFVEDGEQLGSWLAKAKPAEREAMMKQLQADFAVDALLGNWDAVGLNYDNILVDRSGAAWRIDNGGALAFRAQGARKTAEEWAEWVPELWTMRGKEIAVEGAPEAMFGKTKTQTQPAATAVYGSANFYDIARRIEAIQGEKLAGIVPKEQLAIVEARLAKMKELATKALDHEFDKFKPALADEKLQIIHAMDKRGLFAGLNASLMNHAPGQVTLYGDGKAWGYLRGKGATAATKKASPGAPAPLKEDIFWGDLEKALKHVGSHMKGGKIGDGVFEPAKYKPALAHKPALEKLTQDKKAPLAVLQMANLYLKALGELEKAIAGQAGSLSSKYEQPLQAPPKVAAPAKPKASHDSIVAAYANFAEAVGIKTQIADDWMHSLSGSATAQGAMRMKAWIFEQMEGLKEQDYHWDLPLVTAKNMVRELEGRWGGGAKGAQAVNLAFTGWQALVQEVFARSELPFNDRQRRVVRIIRTDKAAVMRGIKPGQLSELGKTGRRGLAESASLVKTTSVHASEVTIQAVPYSHILGFYAMERVSRRGQTSFLNEDENEVPIIAGRIPFRYLGSGKDPDLNPQSDATKWGLPLDHIRAAQQKRNP